MAEVKWIKITTDIFNDEKIKIIDTMPARDEIIVIWFKLLALAGKVNQNGLLFMSNKIAYTPEMLAAVFNRDLNIIKLALATFEKFKMVDVEDNEVISISNWEKHQNIDGMTKIREQNRLRVAKHRANKQKLLGCNITGNVTVTESNAIEEEGEEDKELELEEDKELEEEKKKKTILSKNNICTIQNEWNALNLHALVSIKNNRLKLTKARVKEYGLDKFIDVIKSIQSSTFCKGQNNRGWVITYDWLIKPNNFIKVLEGKYRDKQGGEDNGVNEPSNQQNAYKPIEF